MRLPTEYEWQRAATGGDPARTYPWGPDWDPAKEPWRANTDESGLGRSTAVGMYPAGASSAGVVDMAGTLWEWCQNTFDHPDAGGRSWLRGLVLRLRQQQEPRVLRGGSWFNNRDYARSAYRDGDGPNYRVNYIGFRVVYSSPIFEH